jgi:hypothetical protein
MLVSAFAIATHTIQQADIGSLYQAGRLTGCPLVVRKARQNLGGGFGDTERYPYTWTVLFMVDEQWSAIVSARGLQREWASLDRLEKWLRSLEFRFFWVQNEMDLTEFYDSAE